MFTKVLSIKVLDNCKANEDLTTKQIIEATKVLSINHKVKNSQKQVAVTLLIKKKIIWTNIDRRIEAQKRFQKYEA